MLISKVALRKLRKLSRYTVLKKHIYIYITTHKKPCWNRRMKLPSRFFSCTSPSSGTQSKSTPKYLQKSFLIGPSELVLHHSLENCTPKQPAPSSIDILASFHRFSGMMFKNQDDERAGTKTCSWWLRDQKQLKPQLCWLGSTSRQEISLEERVRMGYIL